MVRNRLTELARALVSGEHFRRIYGGVASRMYSHLREDRPGKDSLARRTVDNLMSRDLNDFPDKGYLALDNGESLHYAGRDVQLSLTRQEVSLRSAQTKALNYLLRTDEDFRDKYQKQVERFQKQTILSLVLDSEDSEGFHNAISSGSRDFFNSMGVDLGIIGDITLYADSACLAGVFGIDTNKRIEIMVKEDRGKTKD